ncbi:hypothetical protein J1N35_021620 [Gossypium stocksii]|uniref:Reverse transcriptase zinc-binding domain-containing protein n=1 Tax=Gossypium stocksii TaxID=47602 RepID=A0A9D3VH41_9ROSI|nr:hypothetical protein J1N35_021620 [Gossypium stocksii]
MRLASQERKITWAKICRSAPPIMHLMFVDNCILFGSATYRRCQNGAESREHVFRDCPIANETWTKLGFSWSIQDGNSDFKDWLNNIFELYSLKQCRVFACALWVLWTTRNKFIHEGEVKTGSQMVDFIKNYIQELDGLSTCLLVSRLHLTRWVALTNPRFKINFDAAFNKEKKESYSGFAPKCFFTRTYPQPLLLKFVSREANKVAHLIAKEGIQKGETTYLQNAVSTGVEEALMEDRRWTEAPQLLRVGLSVEQLKGRRL